LQELIAIANRQPERQMPSITNPKLWSFPRKLPKSIWICLGSMVLVTMGLWTLASWNRWLGSSPHCLAIVLWAIDPTPENISLKNRILQEILFLLSRDKTGCFTPYEEVVQFTPENDSALGILNQTGADLNLQLWLGNGSQPFERKVTGFCSARDGTVQWYFEAAMHTDQFEPEIHRIVEMIQKKIQGSKQNP
jgi:hypothetical protein